MGIPSYYKRLYDSNPQLVQKRVSNAGADILLFDFNCLIYHCVRGPRMPVYSVETKDEWETALFQEIKRYVLKIWEVAGKPREVFLAVDGVVPMAKIRQQRLRRFKSVWLAGKEVEAGVRVGGWDTNQITPGTEFMEKLSRELQTLCKARGWTVSGAEEPGEGEQKLMEWLRRRGDLAGLSVCVYGLDADLIVLSLLHLSGAPCKSWKLLREAAEFGMGKAEGDVFSTFDVKLLLGIVCESAAVVADRRCDFMMDYVCGMSLLGNDFLPHSLSVKIKEGGYDRFFAAMKGCGRLVVDGKVQYRGILQLVEAWALEEEGQIHEGFKEKYSGRGPPCRTDADRLMLETNRLPLTWSEESCMWSAGRGFVPEWRDIYYSKWMRGSDMDTICREYCVGLQWIMDYYTGKPVSYQWYFPWSLPPLWSDLAVRLKVPVMPVVTAPLKPQEQLALVLPLESWDYVRDAALRDLPQRFPAFWPRRFGFFSAGRKLLWECEPEIPVLTVGRFR